MTNLNEKKMKSTLKNVQKNEIHKFKITSRQNINKKIYKKYMNEVEEYACDFCTSHSLFLN